MADALHEPRGSRQNRLRGIVWGSVAAVLGMAASLWHLGAASGLRIAPPETETPATPRPRPRPSGRSPMAELMAVAPADLRVAVRERCRPWHGRASVPC